MFNFDNQENSDQNLFENHFNDSNQSIENEHPLNHESDTSSGDRIVDFEEGFGMGKEETCQFNFFLTRYLDMHWRSIKKIGQFGEPELILKGFSQNKRVRVRKKRFKYGQKIKLSEYKELEAIALPHLPIGRAEIDLPSNLVYLQLAFCDLKTNISVFSTLVQLQKLDIGEQVDTSYSFFVTTSAVMINEWTFIANGNELEGNLDSLKPLKKLRFLCIGNQIKLQGDLEVIANLNLDHFGFNGTIWYEAFKNWPELLEERCISDSRELRTYCTSSYFEKFYNEKLYLEKQRKMHLAQQDKLITDCLKKIESLTCENHQAQKIQETHQKLLTRLNKQKFFFERNSSLEEGINSLISKYESLICRNQQLGDGFLYKLGEISGFNYLSSRLGFAFGLMGAIYIFGSCSTISILILKLLIKSFQTVEVNSTSEKKPVKILKKENPQPLVQNFHFPQSELKKINQKKSKKS